MKINFHFSHRELISLLSKFLKPYDASNEENRVEHQKLLQSVLRFPELYECVARIIIESRMAYESYSIATAEVSKSCSLLLPKSDEEGASFDQENDEGGEEKEAGEECEEKIFEIDEDLMNYLRQGGVQ